MDKVKVAKELVRLAKELMSGDKDLEAVAEVVKNGSFMNLRGALSKLGFKKVDFDMMGGAHWSIKTKSGKTIVVINKQNADPGNSDITVGDFVVGYM